MKNKFLLSIFSILILSNGFSQSGYQGAQIPNYIFADNAPFIVAVVTQLKTMEISHTGGLLSSGSGMRTRQVEKIDLKTIENHDEKFLMQLFLSCTQEFKTLQMNPAGFIARTQASIMSNTDKWLDDLESQFGETGPQYMITIILPPELNKAIKAVDKGNFSLDLVKPVSISISKFSLDRKNPPLPYSLAKLNMSIADGFNIIKKDIDSKPKSYFLKSLPENQLVDFGLIMDENDKYFDYFKGGEEINSLPSDLLETTLVAYDTQKGKFKKNGKDITETVVYKKLAKEYPGKFTTMDPSEYLDYVNNPKYKYILLMEVRDIKKITTTTPSNRNNVQGKSKSVITSNFFYYLKDINTKKSYYSELGKQTLEEHAQSHLLPSLDYFFKVLKDYYKWN